MPPDATAMAALQALRPPAQAPGMAPASTTKEMPMAMDKPTKELFLDRSLFKDLAVKKGQEVTITGKITTPGSSIGFTPSSVAKVPELTPEAEFDEDLDTEPGSKDGSDDESTES